MLTRVKKACRHLLMQQRGVSLLMALLVGMVLSAAGYATIHMLMTDANLVATQAASTQAFWLAEAGLERGLGYLRTLPTPPAGIAPFTIISGEKVGTGHITVAIDPDDDNSVQLRKAFKIISTGTVAGISRKLEIQVKTVSFGNFVYLTGSEGGTIWFNSSDLLDGPIHTNDQFAITGRPTFLGKVTSVATSFKKRGSFKPDFRKGYQLGVAPVVFPTFSDVMNTYKLLSGGINPPLTIDASGKRDVSMVFNADGTLTYSIWTIDWRGKIVYLVKDKTVSLSALNGMLLVKGDVSIKGTVKGQLTVVTTGNINIAGDILYADSDANGKPPAGSKNLLGLVSGRNIIVKVAASNNSGKGYGKGGKKGNGVKINAAILALGTSFTVEKYNQGTPRGLLTIYGSLSQKVRGPVGTFTQFGTATGFDKDYHFDPRLAVTPPPYFPTTGQYEVFSWRESE